MHAEAGVPKVDGWRVLLVDDDQDIRRGYSRVLRAQEGCDLLQGYLFARPDRGFPEPRW